MKRLSLLVAASALLVAATATTAQAQMIIGGPGAQVALPGVPVTGPLLMDETNRRIPQGVNETGRYPRYISDWRLSAEELQYRNRDFEAWYPLEPRSKERILRSIRGNLRTARHPIIDQEVGRLVRFVAQDDKLLHNNMILTNRDFTHFKPIYAPISRRLMDNRVRGLAAIIRGAVQPGRILAIRSQPIDTDPLLMRFY